MLDKYEYRVKTEQMLACVNDKAYDKAMEIADSIDWKKVKNATMICTVSEIYEQNEEFQKSRDVLFVAYDRAPGSRKIVYRLGALALKLGDINEATDCYEEFIKIAPKDPNQHILKYKVLKAQKAPIEQQIEALEEFKKAEYIEKWAYELARLYDEAGMTSECLEECDDLILWFSEGRYVYQAMELKMRYKPLTPLQQEKFRQRHTIKQQESIKPLEAKAPAAEAESINTEHKEKEESVTMAMPVIPVSSVSPLTRVIPQTEINEAIIAAAAVKQAEEASVQRKDVQTGAEVTGQIKIEEILKEWEAKQREAAIAIREIKEKAATEKLEQERQVEEKKKIGDTGSQLSDDIQKLMADIEKGEGSTPPAIPVEAVQESVEEVIENKGALVEEFLIDEEDAETLDEDEFFDDDDDDEVEDEDLYEEVPEDDESFDKEDEFYDDEEVEFYDEDELEDEDIQEEMTEEDAQPVSEEAKEDSKDIPEVDDREIEDPVEAVAQSPGGTAYDTGFVVQGRYDLSATSEIGLKAGLTEEQKQLFSYFVPVRGMSDQIFEVLENDKNCKTRYGTSRVGNVLVVGRRGSGKTVLAVDIVKAIQKARNLKQGKVAIVTGEALNNKELSVVIQKLHGGAIIVEKAGKLSPKKVKELNELMEEQTGELLVVLEDQRKALDRIMATNSGFKKKFTSKLELPIFINDELVTFGQIYAKENGYLLDDMGILALYSRIDMMQREDHAVTVAEVKEIMDEAIAHSQKANVKHLVKRVFGKNTDDADRIILKEQDFKN